MKVSWNWISELLTGSADPQRVAARMTIAGLEVEGVERLGESFTGVIVAELISKRPHPKSAKLTLVTVTDGATTQEVVCGASNVPEPGAKVLWAPPGARLPDGRVLATKEVAGVPSPGMLCSEAELGLPETVDGIIVLAGEDAGAAPGTAAADALGLRDFVLEIAVPANRPDALGHLGIAREIAALFHHEGLALRRPDASLDGLLADAAAGDRVAVGIDDAVGCPRYTARVVEGLAVQPSPRWLRRRLEAVGVRPISNLVDVTNYVMFELGQPLHAFDADKLRGGKILVRRAREGERMTTLDEQERALLAGDLLICDGEGPVALAGVMGGGGSEVGAGTRRVLLESATFDARSVRRTAQRLGLHSESSHRFERGVDPSGVDFASARAARLLAQLGGGRVLQGLVDVYPRRVAPTVVELRPARVARLLGVTIPTETIAGHLKALGLGVDAAGDTLAVSCPTFRPDLEREVDLIEEIARLHGFDSVPATLPPSQHAPKESGDRLAETTRDALAAAGLDETISMGFTSRARLEALHLTGRPALGVKNPMQEEQAVLRTSLLPGLLGALARNLSFGLTDVRLFEVGHIFLRRAAGLPDEPRFAAGVICGERPGWLKASGPVDFYDLKGVVERLAAALRVPVDFVASRREDGFLHPGVAAAILVGETNVGVVGEVHPRVRDALAIERACFAFELNLELLPPLAPAKLAPIGRYPAIVRDVSFFVDDFVPAARVRDVVQDGRPPILESLRVLEDYRETGKVPAGKKGMLWSLTYRAPDRTLTEDEVDRLHEGIVGRLLTSLRAERR